MKKFIKDSLCGPDDNDCEHAPKTLVRAEGCIKSIRDHQDYFHFSFVRNPFSRMYSAYRYVDVYTILYYLSITIMSYRSLPKYDGRISAEEWYSG